MHSNKYCSVVLEETWGLFNIKKISIRTALASVLYTICITLCLDECWTQQKWKAHKTCVVMWNVSHLSSAMALKVCATVHNPLDAVAKQPLYRLVGPVPTAEANSYLIYWHQLKNTAKIGHFSPWQLWGKLSGKALYSLKNSELMEKSTATCYAAILNLANRYNTAQDEVQHMRHWRNSLQGNPS